MAETIELQTRRETATRELSELEIQLNQTRGEYEASKATFKDLQKATDRVERAKQALSKIEEEIAESTVGDYIKQRNEQADAAPNPLRQG